MDNIIEYFGHSSERRKCGYCKQQSDSTYGMWAHALSPQSYQTLIDRNWRRSGKYCYKPINDDICCPMYTIRCDVRNFKLRKSHKKVIKSFNNYIKNDSRPSKHLNDSSFKNEANGDDFQECPERVKKFASNVDDINIDTDSSVKVSNAPPTIATAKTSSSNETQLSATGSGGDLEKSKKQLGMNKKKFMRRQKLMQKVMKRENCTESEAIEILFQRSCQKQQKAKSLEDFLDEYNCPEPKHVFQKKLIPVTSSNKNAFDESFNVYSKYQKGIHKEADHKISSTGFKQFLVDSPIKYQPNNIPSTRDTELVRYYGSFHQNYYIDGRLVAVAVLDVLPNCISSVYLFYDPEFNFLNLGIYSALNEIALVRKFSELLPDLKYYYMGFYIHSCPKMKYKGQFLPSDLLCSETFRWFSIDSCVSKLANQKYSRFCDDPQIEDEDGKVKDKDINVFDGQEISNLVNYKMNHSLPRSSLKQIQEFGRLVGKRCLPNMLYYVS